MVKQIPPSFIDGKTYFADEEGYILNAKGQRLKDHSCPRLDVPSSHGGDYPCVPIAGKNRYIHKLVCAAFWGIPEAGFVCHHLDGNKYNNRPENLIWVHKTAHPKWDKAVREGHIFKHVDPQKQIEYELTHHIEN